MKRLFTVVALLAMVAVSAFAENGSLHAKIPFNFFAAGKELPAGNYVLNIESQGNPVVTLQNTETGRNVTMMVMSRISEGSNADAKLVFDSVGDKKLLQSVWSGSQEAGYQVSTAKQNVKFAVQGAPHTQQVIALNK